MLPKCHVVGTREPDKRLWTFYLVNDDETAIEKAEMKEVRYEFGDQYLGGKSLDLTVRDLAPGSKAPVWTDNEAAEMRTDLWIRVTHRGVVSWMLFEFPNLYRQTVTILTAHPQKMNGPPSALH